MKSTLCWAISGLWRPACAHRSTLRFSSSYFVINELKN